MFIAAMYAGHEFLSMTSILFTMQLIATIPVKMEGPAQLMTLAHVMRHGLGWSVKHVGKSLIYCLYSCCVPLCAWCKSSHLDMRIIAKHH